MTFQISIISVRPSVDARELTINQTTKGNFTVVGRLFQVNSDSVVGASIANTYLRNQGGGRTTIIMNSEIAADLTAAAQALYPIEQTPFYAITFNVKALSAAQYTEGVGYNITVNAVEFVEVSAAPIEPDMLNDVPEFNNAANADAAIRSAEAYSAGVERRQLQSQVVAAGAEVVKRSGRGRKPKAETTV